MADRSVIVVGGGISGLAAAWELSGGAEGPGPRTPSVVVVEGSRLGGKLATVDLDGVAVDVGPDGFLGRRPEAAALCREAGLSDALEPIGAAGAAVWARGRRRPLPDGLSLGVPTRWVPVARSGILSPWGSLRLASDALLPRPDARGPLGDRAVGPLVARKLGRQVVDRFVDPLVGGIHAGGVSDASAAAVFPALLQAAPGRGSLMRALRRAAAAPAHGENVPAFWSVRGGFEALVDRLAGLLADRGVEIRTGQPVQALERAGSRWSVHATGAPIDADGVVLAAPAGAAATLLSPHDADAAGVLRAIEYASVALVTLELDAGALDDDLFGTGLLVPPGTRLAGMDDACLVTACTYLWAKWPHLRRPGTRLLRASVGRYGDVRYASMDDESLAARVVAELSDLVGLRARPLRTLVTRWEDALPQYRVHHLLRVGNVEAAVKRLGGLAVAGAAYRGVGIPACVGSGRAAARDVLEQLAPDRAVTRRPHGR